MLVERDGVMLIIPDGMLKGAAMSDAVSDLRIVKYLPASDFPLLSKMPMENRFIEEIRKVYEKKLNRRDYAKEWEKLKVIIYGTGYAEQQSDKR